MTDLFVFVPTAWDSSLGVTGDGCCYAQYHELTSTKCVLSVEQVVAQETVCVKNGRIGACCRVYIIACLQDLVLLCCQQSFDCSIIIISWRASKIWCCCAVSNRLIVPSLLYHDVPPRSGAAVLCCAVLSAIV